MWRDVSRRFLLRRDVCTAYFRTFRNRWRSLLNYLSRLHRNLLWGFTSAAACWCCYGSFDCCCFDCFLRTMLRFTCQARRSRRNWRYLTKSVYSFDARDARVSPVSNDNCSYDVSIATGGEIRATLVGIGTTALADPSASGSSCQRRVVGWY